MAASEASRVEFQKRLLATTSTLPIQSPMDYYHVGVAVFRQHQYRDLEILQVLVIKGESPVGVRGVRWELPHVELGHHETIRQGVHRALSDGLRITVQDDRIVGEFEPSTFVKDNYGFFQLNFLVDGGSVELPLGYNGHPVGCRWVKETEFNRFFSGAILEHFENAFRSYKEKLGEGTTSGEGTTTGQ
ncbi:hypothetical protein EDB80DRAFT_897724 [Ilyonectria destructans]|nr:hypothetical protein EDB80DRAFT_897724 [Ilyonectria destructans]